ncbi:PREDICTED: uncharacterized protein LOC104603803 [Nelumbo nucifera]|uniref:Uncharacterized protein LOC104603803 n=2 Tax=Nelumbo nucifera TaxID=4432 RepID=A0A1U8ATQ3_NELNU|nr:PREDICTED: uncharacterized protein LOC104603803 [Nelumbo nucifera]DAD41863.1 TPA_asm: hypothetical protein HUJ06_016186 [Nelumbo nucifera]
MGREMAPQLDRIALENRPGIFVIGSSNVGKRTLLSRLLSVDFEDAFGSSSELFFHGWTIDTKYYTADVSVWMAHLDEEFSVGMWPISNQLAALVMVFDTSDLASFTALQHWVSRNDIQKFDILLCIGNKVDLLPGHFAHTEYRRHLQKRGESFSDPHAECLDYGILETEGSSLLGDEEPSWEIRRSCLEWCCQYNIEYIEACASNADFDRCLSVNGDSQGVERLYGALSAHIWPGMILKSGSKIAEPCPFEKGDLSEEESDYEIEYEILSAGSAEPWDETEVWVSADGSSTNTDKEILVTQTMAVGEHDRENKVNGNDGLQLSTSEPYLEAVSERKVWVCADGAGTDTDPDKGEPITKSVAVEEHNQEHEVNENRDELQPSTAEPLSQQVSEKELTTESKETENIVMADDGTHLGLEDLEQLMSEIGNMRASLRLMPDFQRREMAAKLAMKVAAMFGDSSGDENDFD